jgi:hypothetical protein
MLDFKRQVLINDVNNQQDLRFEVCVTVHHNHKVNEYPTHEFRFLFVLTEHHFAADV